MATRDGALIRVVFDTDDQESLNLIGRTLEDLNALCELMVAVTDPKYSKLSVSSNWRVRRGSRLNAPDQLYVQRMQLASPLVVDILVPVSVAAAATWPIMQALEKIANWRSEREARRTRQDRELVGLARDQVALARELVELDELLSRKQAERAFEQAARRLSNDLPIQDVALTDPPDRHGE